MASVTLTETQDPSMQRSLLEEMENLHAELHYLQHQSGLSHAYLLISTCISSSLKA